MTISIGDLIALLKKADELRDTPDNDKHPIAPLLCSLHEDAGARLDAFFAVYDQTKKSQSELRRLGADLESVVAWSFAGLIGLAELKSYRAAGGQYDLLAAGQLTDPRWRLVHQFLEMPSDRSDMLVEVKATATRIDAQQVLRMCALVDSHFERVGLVVLVCPKGATGHPTRRARVHGLRDCRLHQVLFKVRKRVAIVVLDREDIEHMAQAGGLIRRLLYRIRELDQLHGRSPPVESKPVEDDLPAHMRPAADWANANARLTSSGE